ncbi:GNAT family N-acetyltransferase [Microbacterium sp. 18062]|uniref:GNAT family N-acetyltransferase n=1 Tax=Microbacterium sp. 18062 TaxID=2681410 RepID=UPI0013597424|nr:GNAT family N-acetyltransferase [Microbacterium sp. 18062]
MAIVTLEPWAPQHLSLLIEANTAAMTRGLGGPESDEEVHRRHERYLRLNSSGETWMFAIQADGEPAGGIGFWPIEHGGEAAHETGWNVLPQWQGQGIAGAALRTLIQFVVEKAPPGKRLFAYPSVHNAASNALCRTAGFDDLGERDFPFRGTVLHTRVWALDLRPGVGDNEAARR